ncbi:hypothetical protein [Granulicatella seriolae]|uniref:Uncharacterized protein n=1 Tax=Granulicatella seriolae TaxID=2967226 RepID=A0ABT1WLX9_9LACT|nr:hypothetical protein [Granulicatella seriolae]
MFEVTDIDERIMDRDIYLRNIVTEKEEECFDNSIGYSDDNNFLFMRIGSKYECKILLIGDQTKEENKEVSKLFFAEERSIKIGKHKFLKVYLDEEEYYILEDEIVFNDEDKYILFDFFRKDLLEVDGHVSPMYID